jgi:hypothetical protein
MENAHCQFVGVAAFFMLASRDEIATNFFRKISSPNFDWMRTSVQSSFSLRICSPLEKQGTDTWQSDRWEICPSAADVSRAVRRDGLCRIRVPKITDTPAVAEDFFA